MALLYADENFPAPVVRLLRQLGHDVLTAHEAGQAGQGISDNQVLAFAVGLGRAVLAHNRKHFRDLHNARHSHRGMILCTADPNFASLAERSDVEISMEGDLSTRMIRVNRPVAQQPPA